MKKFITSMLMVTAIMLISLWITDKFISMYDDGKPENIGENVVNMAVDMITDNWIKNCSKHSDLHTKPEICCPIENMNRSELREMVINGLNTIGNNNNELR